MRKLTLALAGALLLPAIAEAQLRASAGISFDLPVVLPQLVVIQPGVQVVPDCDHEVFYTNGYYWAREDDVWYRSRSHRGGWVMAPVRTVPVALVRVPPGHYKHWKPEKHGGPGPGRAYYGGRPQPAPAYYRGGERDYDRHDHDRGDWDDDHGRGGHGNGKHKGKH
ncbi:hypothetical protein [Anaeromyxobacter terrae]|uniref:hypothetical protein n=1 Tax=Anaeromyxobacter terrae TaxID=2925406 RepID=UPI001F56256D|nr:hypothetical protein [Anaeromyxobacter sp. SG22]